ncbi:hypothetical protein [Pelagibius sp. Alg239-R121]|uniref:hypothetical protein n=1 Tax=Pelagibius sp. Alg239-R121 TaxID=2993448 RepID=UPI0024A761D9|nr:hypothetical protein [Pelagibius sp. Alg239-R121]
MTEVRGKRNRAATSGMMTAVLFGAGLFFLQPLPAQAGGADVVGVEAVQDNAGKWRFNVTVAHADEGWDHYANKWDIVAPDGTVLGTRVLHHPHENEQPFTRSLGGVEIPADITEVTLRANDSQHGYEGKPLAVKLER